MASGLLAGGVQPVGKHVPGHGRARVDSHLQLPELADVLDSDLAPFMANRALPWFMTAHIRYMSHDTENPATQSSAIIRGVIRAEAAIGFGGVLLSDDLAMQALSGPPGTRAARAIAAGCDVALHCSGVLAESRAVLEALPEPTEACLARIAAGRALVAARRQAGLDAAALFAERAALLS
jgi:beta-N-acetylhexosaminidase